MFCHYVLVLFVATASVTTVTCLSTTIRSWQPEFALEAGPTYVVLQHFTGSPSQLWSRQPTDGGRVFIINDGTGKVLDIEGNPGVHAKVKTSQKHGGLTQQWIINSDSTIMSAADNRYVLDICYFTPGTTIVTYLKHGGRNQKFFFGAQ